MDSYQNNAQKFLKNIIRPALETLELKSEAAEILLLGTVCVESDICQYVTQCGGGPALGPFQIEPATHYDVWQNFINYRPILRERIMKLIGNYTVINDQLLIDNHQYSAAIARIIYFRIPEKLPEANDFEGLATYWKKYYNTSLGKGDIGIFLKKLRTALCLTSSKNTMLV